ncbi:MAG TPA: energy-coupling factor ABC transporter permease [Anaerolineales bacterium]|nr:energy-coupling factor ABC transporter permease [Anaerolineales bacterium]
MLFAPARMHIPDGFLSTAVSVVGWILSVACVATALRMTRRQMGERQVPVMGVMAAFIFAAQAVNFPVAAGTSGHLVGATLAAIVLGPWASVLVMTSVLVVQALLFQDGGLIVLGWNLVNMAVLGSLTGYGVYRLVLRAVGDHRIGRLASAFAAAWSSVMVGALAVSVELAISGTASLTLALPAMAGVHGLIGLGEGIITVGALALLLASRPELLRGAAESPGQATAHVIVAGLLLALLAALAAPLASTSPDGLNAVAGALAFADRARSFGMGMWQGYVLPGSRDAATATILAVGVGSLVVFGVAFIVGRSLRPTSVK